MDDDEVTAKVRFGARFKYGAVIAASLLSIALPGSSIAGRDPEEWDDLPQIDAFSFSKASVGFTAFGRHYVLDRSTIQVREVLEEKYEQEFSEAIGTPAAEVIEDTGIGSTLILKASSGMQLTTRNAYCSEGEDTKHALWLNGKPVKDHVDPCHSISATEIVGNQLWLGTRTDGEYGDYPAEGVVIQSMDKGRLIKTLSTKQGLTGDLVRAIRYDPLDKAVWISTNQGINEVDLGGADIEVALLSSRARPKNGF